MNYQFVEDVKRPLKKGECFFVPCIVKEIEDVFFESKIYITPIINHPHTDKENGQKEEHYHVDYRFVKHKNDGNFPTVINKDKRYHFVDSIRPNEKNGKFEYIILPVINEDFKGITDKEFIKKSKIKHKCIHKGKCPHRGYDLSQVPEIDGVITCPLHSLKFNAKTKQLID